MAVDTRQRIEAAASSLLEERSFAEITTRDVAVRAGISEATLFRHITSKTDLFLTVYGHQMDLIMDSCEQREIAYSTKSSTTAAAYVDRILAIYQARAEYYQDNFTNAAEYVLASFDPSSPRKPRTLSQGERMIRLVETVLVEASENGRLRTGGSPRLIAENIHAVELHEIIRTPLREYAVAQMWDRLRPRIEFILESALVEP
ncbi:TetR/AcrR family transcriptional regulator [Enteractinococcus fodinae]|uniref:AcrR family transcriptional regulator n=1 Tax=Enteractinococcus fodinae TaxID=684663 RepID=A0ABU2B490_9MICC|nr:TetR/AcrR family transcriptional regulator [Enteractinococcus fodinae]MDR7348425.1 AcrR family transcriptional regulator [Enteractinococcus fodinae]